MAVIKHMRKMHCIITLSTFSTFSYETMRLYQEGDRCHAVASVADWRTPRSLLSAHPHLAVAAITPFGLNGPWQNAAMMFKFEDTLGYNPLRISDYERAVRHVHEAVRTASAGSLPPNTSRDTAIAVSIG